jgi:hypothetical protein
MRSPVTWDVVLVAGLHPPSVPAAATPTPPEGLGSARVHHRVPHVVAGWLRILAIEVIGNTQEITRSGALDLLIS